MDDQGHQRGNRRGLTAEPGCVLLASVAGGLRCETCGALVAPALVGRLEPGVCPPDLRALDELGEVPCP